MLEYRYKRIDMEKIDKEIRAISPKIKTIAINDDEVVITTDIALTAEEERKLNRVISSFALHTDLGEKEFNGLLVREKGFVSAGKSQHREDIEMIVPEKGLVLISPNGTKWLITISDTGQLVFTQLP